MISARVLPLACPGALPERGRSRGGRPAWRWAAGLLAACCLLLAGGPAVAARVLDQDFVRLWPDVRVWVDEPGTADAAAALRQSYEPPAGPWQNLGRTPHPVWLRVTVQPQADDDGRWILQLDYASLDAVDVYQVDAAGRATLRLQAGDTRPVVNPQAPARVPTAELDLVPGQAQDLLLRVQTSSSLILPLTLGKPASFGFHESRLQIGQGMMLGIGLCLALYSLVQWAMLRESVYAWYACTSLATSAFHASYFGPGRQFLWTTDAWLGNHAAPLASALAFGCAMMFTERALNLQATRPWLGRILWAVAGLVGLLALLRVAGVLDDEAINGLTALLAAPVMPLVIWGAWGQARRGDRAAWPMLVVWLLSVPANLLFVEMLKGRVPANEWTMHLLAVNALAAMALWQAVLGIRLQRLRHRASRNEQLQEMAATDPLTGLRNRRGLEHALDQLLADACAERPLAVLVMDLDGFKAVNDTHGHDVGDRLLQAVAARLRQHLRSGDVVARLGGDEFVALVPDLPSAEVASQLAVKLLVAFDEPFDLGGLSCRVGLTVGYALAPEDGREAPVLLRAADGAMYAGKQAGKGRARRAGKTPAAVPPAPETARAVAAKPPAGEPPVCAPADPQASAEPLARADR